MPGTDLHVAYGCTVSRTDKVYGCALSGTHKEYGGAVSGTDTADGATGMQNPVLGHSVRMCGTCFYYQNLSATRPELTVLNPLPGKLAQVAFTNLGVDFAGTGLRLHFYSPGTKQS